MEKKSYRVAIDLGSSNVTVLVGVLNENGTMGVEAVVTKPTEGVRAGRIDNIEEAGKAIHQAIEEIETQLGLRIEEACAGISGDFVRCVRHTDYVFTIDPQNGVIQSDVDALFGRMRNVQAPDGEIIMERIPQNYLVDDGREVRNPVGSFGKRLSSTFNFILCDETPLKRLQMALRRQGIHVQEILPNALVTPDAVLSPDEKEEGVAVVNLGGGVTDLSVYHHNVLRYIASIPMGGQAINRDIRTLSIPEKHIEGLKCQFGSAVAELAEDDKAVRIQGRTPREEKQLIYRNLATVIEARLTDLIEFICKELSDSGYANRLPYGLVLTGGGARLQHIAELFRRKTGMEVRIAAPDQGFDETSCKKIEDPAYATVAGLLLRGSDVVLRPIEKGKGPKNPPQPDGKGPEEPPQPENTPSVGSDKVLPEPKIGTNLPVADSKQPVVEPKQPVVELQTPELEPEQPTESAEKGGKRGKKWIEKFRRRMEQLGEEWSAAGDDADQEI